MIREQLLQQVPLVRLKTLELRRKKLPRKLSESQGNLLHPKLTNLFISQKTITGNSTNCTLIIPPYLSIVAVLDSVAHPRNMYALVTNVVITVIIATERIFLFHALGFCLAVNFIRTIGTIGFSVADDTKTNALPVVTLKTSCWTYLRS